MRKAHEFTKMLLNGKEYAVYRCYRENGKRYCDSRRIKRTKDGKISVRINNETIYLVEVNGEYFDRA